MVAFKTGPITFEEMVDLWTSVTDESYNNPLLDKENSGLVFIEQAAEQYRRVSVQVDVNTQAMFILPWSGQTAPPASGPAFSRTTLTVTRTSNFSVPIYFTPGEIVVEQRENDWSKTGPIEVTTERRYIVETAAMLGPGEAGPIDLQVVAEFEGVNYNEATEGQINTILQPGVGFNNGLGTVVPGNGAVHQLICSIFPDVPVLRHIGQYLMFIGGANDGITRRIVGTQGPDPSPPSPNGGIFELSAEGILNVTNVVGNFQIGETIQQDGTGATGEFFKISNGKLVYQHLTGTFSSTDFVTGLQSSSTADVDSIDTDSGLTAETNSAQWIILSFPDDLGVAVTNEEEPTGGLCGFLDELGAERGIRRSPGESDAAYRIRVAVPADVVTPAAVLRTGNRILEPFGQEICLRETGGPLLPGIFFDETGDPNGGPNPTLNALDLERCDVTFTAAPVGNFIPGEEVAVTNASGFITTARVVLDVTGIPVVGAPPPPFVQTTIGLVRFQGNALTVGDVVVGQTSGATGTILALANGLNAERRFFVMLSVAEARAFFLVGVPSEVVTTIGDGMFFDDAPTNPTDVVSVTNFFDSGGLQVSSSTSTIALQIYNSINGIKAGGVIFDIYVEEFGCC